MGSNPTGSTSPFIIKERDMFVAPKPNVNGSRFVADAILQYHDKFDHGAWGAALGTMGTSVAGSGTLCGTPACVAGFAVQYLGKRDQWEKLRNASSSYYCVSEYALYLMKLDGKWGDSLFYSWPRKWLNPEIAITVTETPIGDREEDEDDDFFWPNAEEAHHVLHRLADQFEEEAKVTVEKELVQEYA